MDAKQTNGFTHGKPACTGPTQRRPHNLPSPQQGKSICRSDVPHAKHRSVVAHSLVYQSSLRVNGMQPTSPAAWEFVSTKLKESNVKVISQQELVFAKDKGAIIIDIRPAGEYESGHIKDSVNVSLFQLITGWDPVKALRRAGFAFFGVFNGTEVNPDFEDQIFQVTGNEVTSKDTPIVLLCQTGGSILPTSAYKNGKQSRSLMAAYEMLRLGYTNISVLKGGFSEWKRNERPYDVIE